MSASQSFEVVYDLARPDVALHGSRANDLSRQSIKDMPSRTLTLS
jgi:hypothetical protein